MIINLVLEKSAIECASPESAQRPHGRDVRLGEREIAGWRGCHLERLRQISALLPDVPVVANEHRPEITNYLRMALAYGERSRLHIIRIGGIEYCDDRGVVELGRDGLGSSRCDRQSESDGQHSRLLRPRRVWS